MTDRTKNWLGSVLVPALTAAVLLASFVAFGFDVMFDRAVNRKEPYMRREVQEMLDRQRAEIQRDELKTLNQINERLARIEALIENGGRK